MEEFLFSRGRGPGFPGNASGNASGKESSCQCRRCTFHPWVGKIPWSRKWQPTPVLLPGKFQGQRSLAGYSPWRRKELDTTWAQGDHFSLSAVSVLLFLSPNWFGLFNDWWPLPFPSQLPWTSGVLSSSIYVALQELTLLCVFSTLSKHNEKWNHVLLLDPNLAAWCLYRTINICYLMNDVDSV